MILTLFWESAILLFWVFSFKIFTLIMVLLKPSLKVGVYGFEGISLNSNIDTIFYPMFGDVG